MAKFKVGDKVNCAEYGNGVISKIVTHVMPEIPYYVVFESGKEIYLGEERLTSASTREFIVIHRDGNVMTAEHRVNREVIKSAKATCSPSDTFDFITGAKLAFDRLMVREESTKRNSYEDCFAHSKQCEARSDFKIGQRVSNHGKFGVVVGHEEPNWIWVMVDGETKHPNPWLDDNIDKKPAPAPAPEPPKFYTGKVFAVEAACKFPGDSALARNGRIFEIVDGIITGDLKPYGMDNDNPYDSFDAFKDRWFSTKWHEVKSDV